MADNSSFQGTERHFTATAAHSVEDVRRAKREWSSRLLRNARRASPRALFAAVSSNPDLNVVGVGVGEKITGNRHTGVMALRFLVRAKLPESRIVATHMLPRLIDGIPTDVEEVGIFRKFAAATTPSAVVNPQTRIRPAQPGCSIGFADPTGQFLMAGTFGALVRDPAGTYILSNNHVLADEGQLPAGSPIFQPGLLDNGNPATDGIARLARFIPLQANAANTVDCAIAEVIDPAQVSKAILEMGPPAGVAAAQIHMAVQKSGRTTGFTAGQVASIDTDVSVQYETGTFTFESQIVVVGMNGSQFSDNGDSGSLIVERNSNAAVGLLFAGSASHTLANHISQVLAALNVTLA
ncbi:MAG TPA: hypothetical protein VKV17_22140 [Bryobacteraceae bacterium]|nr:hypothetical protein [Bryobacteraceae bacterium]